MVLQAVQLYEYDEDQFTAVVKQVKNTPLLCPGYPGLEVRGASAQGYIKRRVIDACTKAKINLTLLAGSKH